MDSPIGSLTLAATATGLFAVEFGGVLEVAEALQARAAREYGKVALQRHPERLQEARRQLEEYFAGKRQTFELSLDLQGTSFQKEVWRALMEIPYGETRSYKQVAEAIGNPKAVRAVGGANNRNPISIVVPCHRVIGANGQLVGYGGGMNKKEILLQLEGISY
ncbi:methylated-DNA--[protein]-cysteine S-methyltransferase [Paenibacillus apiarius]|uniref:Methylated-DNA--protein-cysteine methyltransferase n=2 Tax=Paenibacillus apiarius TaxID=46240 RepID=A0ABT4E190_9BACL|nr:methylated-DNA--[protein]-cysteine S-methyltransferase [Paenibacillus apiarius]MCY9521986.1 methylated-DNA--[protein]-cysteine S-methyltransferase [Paenibacillus apiarius]MCY9550532.1 methylated-DNA--[protein]-cysteine S-methyltransferase [Paenibacillus apiarius]MCY9559819.1 methylated-DNA--[protein]-cysteine S-methyltransferase [Paenibacillus apiarius]MCY9683497.1 methylated-DNA--[protein]-cysteine S-methyltransferase [Paenibacillus apiarius]